MGSNKPALNTITAQMQKWALRLPPLAARLAQDMLFFVYPQGCAGCSRPSPSEESEAFCPDCVKILDLIRAPYCPGCGIPLETPHPHLCGDCLGGTHYFDRARATGLYRGLVREVLHRFKYGGQTFLVRPLAQMLTASGKELTRLHNVDLIVPVPLHPRRLRQRGFNQSALLARRLGSTLGISVDYSNLKRFRWTEPQTGLSHRQRAANVKGAFKLTRPEKMRGKVILLLDDVLTTGETVNQCTRVLQKDGRTSEVVILTVARTVTW